MAKWSGWWEQQCYGRQEMRDLVLKSGPCDYDSSFHLLILLKHISYGFAYSFRVRRRVPVRGPRQSCLSGPRDVGLPCRPGVVGAGLARM